MRTYFLFLYLFLCVIAYGTSCTSAVNTIQSPQQEVPSQEHEGSPSEDNPSSGDNHDPSINPNLVVFNRGLNLTEVIDNITVSRGSSLWVLDPSDPQNSLKELVSGSLGAHLMPSWGPGKTKIVFASNRDQDFSNPSPFLNIYSMDADGSHLQRLTNANGHDWTPSYSPDGNKIAFASTRDHENKDSVWSLDIFVMNSDGSNPINLTQNSHSAQEEDPIFSSDGNTIYYINGEFKIWKVGVSGNPEPSPLCPDIQAGGVKGEDISLTPDGLYLFFRDENRIGKLKLDCSQIDFFNGNLDEPSIGPSQQSLVYMDSGNIYMVDVVDILDSFNKRVVLMPGGDAFFPRWVAP